MQGGVQTASSTSYRWSPMSPSGWFEGGFTKARWGHWAPPVMTRFARAAVPLLVGAAIALLPVPAGLAPHAWHYFAVFVTVILALITEPIPAAGVGLIGVTVIAITGLAFSPAQHGDPGFKAPAEAIRWALAGFANSTVWLIFGAFVFAMGYEKTG